MGHGGHSPSVSCSLGRCAGAAGIANQKLIITTLAWILGLLSFYIKPSGILVLGLIGVIGTVELLIRFWREPPQCRRLLVYGVKFLGIGLGLSAAGLLVAAKTDYMNREVIATAVKAQAALISILSNVSRWQLLASFGQPVVGGWWFFPAIVLIALAVYRAVCSTNRLAICLKIGASVIVVALLLLWWFKIAGPDHRYLFPFLLMLLVWFTGDGFRWLKSLAPSLQAAASVYCLLPPFLLVAMLFLQDPPFALQVFLGVNLSTGGYAEEVRQGNLLCAESVKLQRPLVLFSVRRLFVEESPVGVIEMVGWLQGIQNGTADRFIVRDSIDWADGPGLRIKDLWDCDYILLESVPRDSDDKPVYSWDQEIERFEAFAYRQRDPDITGLKLVSDGTVKVLKVMDPEKFKRALEAWIRTVQWKDDFLTRNHRALEH